MNLKEIGDFTLEATKWVGIYGVGYFATLFACQFSMTTTFQKKIESKKELEEKVKERAKKIGVDSSKIDVIYPSDSTYVTQDKDGRFKMNFWEEGIFNTIGGIDHGLTHIKKDRKDVSWNFFRYWFLEEPRATLYGTFGIKL